MKKKILSVYGERFKAYSLYFFIASLLAATLQGGGLSLITILNDLPPSAHKWLIDYNNYKGFSYGFIWFFSLSTLKYVFYLMSVVTAYFYYLEGRTVLDNIKHCLSLKSTKILAAIIIIGIFPSVIVAALDNQWKLIALGLKSLIPLFAILIGFLLSRCSIKKIAFYLDFCLVSCFVIAVIQILQAYKYCDHTFCTRATGLFIEPNTLASFALARALILYFDENKHHFIIILLCALTIFLSCSRTLGFVFLVSLLFFIRGKFNRLTILMLFGLILMLFSLIKGRGIESFLLRLQNFDGINSSTILFGKGLGSGTQASHLYAKVSNDIGNALLAADMQILSFIFQGGLWYLLALIAATFWIISFGNRRDLIFIFIVFWVTGFGIVTLEVWPLNILIFMCIGYSLAKDSVERFNENRS